MTGIMLILVGAMMPSAILIPQKDLSFSIINLPSTWQIAGILLCSLICGPKIGIISSVTYLLIGLFHLPVFHGGGSVGYILTPEFGYIIGFIPAAWLCGTLATKKQNCSLISIIYSTIIGLVLIHLIGISYLIIGNLIWDWRESLFNLILTNSIAPLPSQMALCLSISFLFLLLKKKLLIK